MRNVNGDSASNCVLCLVGSTDNRKKLNYIIFCLVVLIRRLLPEKGFAILWLTESRFHLQKADIPILNIYVYLAGSHAYG